MSEDILQLLCEQNTGAIDFDVTGSIGKRYRRQDEIGTPLCITVDQEGLENNTFTARYRDTIAADPPRQGIFGEKSGGVACWNVLKRHETNALV